MILLDEIPATGGEWHSGSASDEALPGWIECRLVLYGSDGTMRVVIALFDAEGRPGGLSDMVAREGGRLQESVMARIESDGRVSGTHWDTEGEKNTPRPLTEAEVAGLKQVAGGMWQRSRSG